MVLGQISYGNSSCLKIGQGVGFIFNGSAAALMLLMAEQKTDKNQCVSEYLVVCSNLLSYH